MEPIKITTMRSSAKPTPRSTHALAQRLTLIAIAVLVITILAALFVPRSAHGDSEYLYYVPIAENNLQRYPATVVPVGPPWVAPTPTVTPQPELGEPPFVPVGVDGE